MQAGKLPIRHLEKVLSGFKTSDPRIIAGPMPGEDASLIDMGESYLIATTDPITFTADKIGWYAVNINANDVAVMGGKAKWMMATILLPENFSHIDTNQIFDDIAKACHQLNISVIGGHTEITSGIDRPLISGVMLGEVEKGKEIRSSGAKVGDSIILTKAIPIEGCAILANEAGNQLLKNGITTELIKESRNLIYKPGISIVKDAAIAIESGKINAMHDITEGGIAGGLAELAYASNLGIHVTREYIPEIPQAKIFSEALELDTLGMIGSGSLLICAPEKHDSAIIKNLKSHGINATKIGSMKNLDHGLKISENEDVDDLPRFDTDEIARFFASQR
ncbi:MAG: AIR synthase family protein [Chloroflexota bacterium]|nr:AIR synthase family protein [Chloroflexota bacterium]